MRPRIGVIGSHDCTEREASLAHEVGLRLARAGAIVVTGGLGGVMRHACHGAVEGEGFTVGILPGADAAEANEYVIVPIATAMGEMRNALVVRASQALIAIGGGWGTLSELALARRTGVPVVGLASRFPDGLDYPRAATAAEAVRWALDRVGAP